MMTAATLVTNRTVAGPPTVSQLHRYALVMTSALVLPWARFIATLHCVLRHGCEPLLRKGRHGEWVLCCTVCDKEFWRGQQDHLAGTGQAAPPTDKPPSPKTS